MSYFSVQWVWKISAGKIVNALPKCTGIDELVKTERMDDQCLMFQVEIYVNADFNAHKHLKYEFIVIIKSKCMW